MFLNSFKVVIHQFRVTFKLEMLLICGILITFFALFFLLFWMMIANGHFDGYNLSTPSKSKDSQNYIGTIKEIKYEFFTMLSIMIPSAIIFPGIACSLYPSTLVTPKAFVITLNFLVACHFLIGRIVGPFDFNHFTIIVNQILGYIIMLILLFAYFLELNFFVEGICLIVLILVCFMVFRESTAQIFLLIQTGRKAGEDNKEAAG